MTVSIVLMLLIAVSVVIVSMLAQYSGDGMTGLDEKKILMIIASDNFRDEEYLEPKQIFDDNGIHVTTASSQTGELKGMLGVMVITNTNINSVNVADYDAVVFVGGTGASEYFDSARAHAIATEAYSSGKITAAICIAPSILANAGVLEGKQATAYESEQENLQSHGAAYTGQAVTRDGNIITGNGPAAATEFGNAIVTALSE
jgi:protease I